MALLMLMLLPELAAALSIMAGGRRNLPVRHLDQLTA